MHRDVTFEARRLIHVSCNMTSMAWLYRFCTEKVLNYHTPTIYTYMRILIVKIKTFVITLYSVSFRF